MQPLIKKIVEEFTKSILSLLSFLHRDSMEISEVVDVKNKIVAAHSRGLEDLNQAWEKRVREAIGGEKPALEKALKIAIKKLNLNQL